MEQKSTTSKIFNKKKKSDFYGQFFYSFQNIQEQ